MASVPPALPMQADCSAQQPPYAEREDPKTLAKPVARIAAEATIVEEMSA
jgi:hypothetical protein